MNNPKPARCAIYTRKSSEEGLEQNFNSLHAQREACEAYVLSQKHEGWQVLRTAYDDGGFSGGSMDRPGLKQLLLDIAAKRVDTVVVYKVDRLTRSLADFAKIVEQFDQQGVSFVSVTQQFNTTTSMGRLTLNVLLSFAQFEREVTGERIRDKIALSKRKGMWMGGAVPLGYDLRDRTLHVNEAEAERVRRIYGLYLDLGCVSKLHLRLEELGIRSKQRVSGTGRESGGVAFSRGALYAMLRNPIYRGRIRHGKETYPGRHAAIVEEELWERVQLRLRENRPAGAVHGKGADTAWLVGLLFDGAGNRYTPSHTTRRGKRYRYYVLQCAATESAKSSSLSRLPGRRIEGVVLHQLHLLAQEPERLLPLLCNESHNDEALQELAAAMDRMGSNQVEQHLRSCVTRVTVHTAEVRITLSPGCLRESLGLPQDRFTEATTEVVCPAPSVRRAGTLRFQVPGAREEGSVEGQALLRAIANARAWVDRLTTGEALNQRDLAKQTGLDERYVSRLLPLAFLAPDIVEAALDRTSAAPRELHHFLGNVRLDWNQQRAAFSQNQ